MSIADYLADYLRDPVLEVKQLWTSVEDILVCRLVGTIMSTTCRAH